MGLNLSTASCWAILSWNEVFQEMRIAAVLWHCALQRKEFSESENEVLDAATLAMQDGLDRVQQLAGPSSLELARALGWMEWTRSTAVLTILDVFSLFELKPKVRFCEVLRSMGNRSCHCAHWKPFAKCPGVAQALGQAGLQEKTSADSKVSFPLGRCVPQKVSFLYSPKLAMTSLSGNSRQVRSASYPSRRIYGRGKAGPGLKKARSQSRVQSLARLEL